jgi:hypothetical protein
MFNEIKSQSLEEMKRPPDSPDGGRAPGLHAGTDGDRRQTTLQATKPSNPQLPKQIGL